MIRFSTVKKTRKYVAIAVKYMKNSVDSTRLRDKAAPIQRKRGKN